MHRPGCLRSLTGTWSLRAALACAVAVSAVMLVVTPEAAAAPGAVARASGPVTTATWSVVTVTTGSAGASGSLAIDWSRIKGTSFSFIDSVNSGTVAVSGFAYTLSTARNSQGGQPFPTITLDSCSGAQWDIATNTCMGTVVRVWSSTGGSVAVDTALGVAGRLSLRATSSGPPGSSFTTTISTVVARSDVRAGQTTNE